MITLTVEAHDADELMMKLRGLVRADTGDANVVPLRHVSENTEPTPSKDERPSVLATEASPKSKLTVADLHAGMTLKETATATLGDGTRVAPGDNVMHGGEEWAVYHTYRGRLVAATEDNRADILHAENCTAVVGEDQPPAKPRPGTAAALSQPDPNQRPADQAHAIGAPVKDATIDPKVAAELRDAATEAVSQEKISVEAVFQKLNELGGVSSIDALSAENGRVFQEWLDAQVKPKPSF